MAASKKDRLDKLLVDRQLCETRNQAQSLIMAGEVLVNEQRVDKPGVLVAVDADIRVKTPLAYVSRGGQKLAQALDTFGVSPVDQVCLDVGASTGGFTDCLLQRGASRVYAVDVGYGQLAWALRQDPRVVVCEKTHILNLAPETLDPRPTLAVIDVSFISIQKVLGHVRRCLQVDDAGAGLGIIALVKPQFEFKDHFPTARFTGVVTDPKAHRVILSALAASLPKLVEPLVLLGMVDSPILGPKGNREFLFYFGLPSADKLPLLPESEGWNARLAALGVTDL